MHRTFEKKAYTGIAAALAVFLAVASVVIWQISKHAEARMLGLAAVFGGVAASPLLGYALVLVRRGSRD
ncbi:MAG: hypothetical protein ABIP20_20355, partial [Chthoniobacteraceae bacterium]